MKQFINISQAIGKHPEYVQGRGGNTSYKKGNEMYIKASGFLLQDVRKNNGYTVCKIKPILDFFESKTIQTDIALDKLIGTVIQEEKSFGKPSMETAMHALIPSRYVIHSHSIYANIFNCLEHPEKYLQHLFSYDYKVIPYQNPGYFLAKYLANLQNKQKLSQVIFLKNHGLLIHGNSANEVLKLHTEVNNILKQFLTKSIDVHFTIKKTPADFSEHLFPDSVVYSSLQQTDIPDNKQQEFYEICSAINFIKKGLATLKQPTAYISEDNVEYIKNMEQEKHRMNMIR
jgi:rhamnose utilization protein RhaD (predicted bifunctional aldolase and dehydrogenase)